MTAIEQVIEAVKKYSSDATFYKEDIISLLELAKPVEGLQLETAELRGRLRAVIEQNTHIEINQNK